MRRWELVDDVIAAVDIERVAGNKPGRVMCEKGRGQTHIHDVHQAARGRLRLRLVKELIEFRDPGSSACRKRAWRYSVDADALGTYLGRNITHSAFKGSLRDAHDIVVLDDHLTAIIGHRKK